MSGRKRVHAELDAATAEALRRQALERDMAAVLARAEARAEAAADVAAGAAGLLAGLDPEARAAFARDLADFRCDEERAAGLRQELPRHTGAIKGATSANDPATARAAESAAEGVCAALEAATQALAERARRMVETRLARVFDARHDEFRERERRGRLTALVKELEERARHAATDALGWVSEEASRFLAEVRARAANGMPLTDEELAALDGRHAELVARGAAVRSRVRAHEEMVRLYCRSLEEAGFRCVRTEQAAGHRRDAVRGFTHALEDTEHDARVRSQFLAHDGAAVHLVMEGPQGTVGVTADVDPHCESNLDAIVAKARALGLLIHDVEGLSPDGDRVWRKEYGDQGADAFGHVGAQNAKQKRG